MPEWLPRILDFELLVLAGVPVTVSTLLTGLTIIVAAYAISKLVQRGMARAFVLRGVEQRGSTAVVARLMHYVIMIAGVGIALGTIGVDVAALFAAGAFFAVAVGLAMQSVAQNFLSGIIMLVERSIEPGHVLEVNGTVVRVAETGIRATIVRTLDDEKLIVPNSVLVDNTVKNFTLEDSLYRLRAVVGVSYESDMKQVFETLQNVAANLTWRHSHEPRILMIGFGDSSVNFEVSVWMDDPWEMRAKLSALYEAIWWGLKDAGITIAFPQVDMHIDEPVMKSLHQLAAARGD